MLTLLLEWMAYLDDSMVQRSAQVWLTSLIVALGVYFSPAAAASEPGEGVKAGNFKLSPSLTLGGTYDFNIFRENPSDPGQIATAPVLSIEPGLTIGTINPAFVTMELEASLEWEQYLSSIRAVQQQSGLNGSGDFALTLNKEGTVSLRLHDNLQYTNEPPPTRSPVSYRQFVNRSGLKLGIHPGDDVLRIGVGYEFGLHRYLTPSLVDLAKNEHRFKLDATWKFLPKTSVVLEGDFRLVNYLEDRRDIPNSTATLQNVDSTPLRVRGGFSGLISRQISLRLLGGYAASFYENVPADSDRNFSGPLAMADLTYKYGSDSKFSIGYEFGFEDSSVSNYYTFHKAGASWVQKFSDGRYQLSLDASYTRRDYSELEASGGTVPGQGGGQATLPDSLVDNFIEGNAEFKANFFKWWSASVRYGYTQNITPNQVGFVGAGGGQTYLRAFNRHAVSIGTTLRY